jgi:hypothetical protein
MRWKRSLLVKIQAGFGVQWFKAAFHSTRFILGNTLAFATNIKSVFAAIWGSVFSARLQIELALMRTDQY